MSNNSKVPNRLANEKSPYLLQHAHNPVDWYPWSEEAFSKAKSENKPIFLSIGYSTCHWCHVMERESFEDNQVAALLNENYISIKVDREERPDIDHIYMSVCQALTGHGGWPLTIIMTPDKKPFFADTYFPQQSSYGRPGLMDILKNATTAWNEKYNDIINSSNRIASSINDFNYSPSDAVIDENVFKIAFEDFNDTFDSRYGGFGNQPKFPIPHNLYFLLRYWKKTNDMKALSMVEKTLENMYRGGIYDHIGFGFSRYSTDNQWLVPHFEKMLYDNALISIAYLEAYQATKNELFSKIARDIFEYILRDMTSLEGGFYCAEDADSEGVEGKFYIWDYAEVISLLGESEGNEFCKQFNITKRGNFEEKNIPNLIGTQNINLDEKIRNTLFEYRNKRIHPYKDDKILTSWNGLMIAALSIGGRVLKDNRYIDAAKRATTFIYTKLFNNNGRLMARYRDGEASFLGYADDYSFLTWGLIELYESTFNPEYLKKALSLNDSLIKLFFDNKNGGLFIYGSDSEELIARPKEVYDGATPSANSVSTFNWVRLSRLTGDTKFDELVQSQFKAFGNAINSNPTSYTFMLCAYLFTQSTSKEIVIVGDLNSSDTNKMIESLNRNFNPFTTVLVKALDIEDSILELVPYIAEYNQVEDKPTAYVCQNFSCQAPINDINQFETSINQCDKFPYL